jgi:hypothetical protein
MPNLIIIRLTPANPTSGDDFTNYLTNLHIKAFDLSFNESKKGVPIGEASGAWSPPSDPLDPKLTDFSPATPRIFQHFSKVLVMSPLPPTEVIKPEAVATAVIEIKPLFGHTEYQTTDLRLEITNDGLTILDQNVDFNVVVTSDPLLSTNPRDYIDLPSSALFSLPDPQLGKDPNVAFVEMPADGTAPSFEDVTKAVNTVLAADPNGGTPPGVSPIEMLSPLTALKARHVAREITWNPRLSPPPTPPRRLEEMYTRPAYNHELPASQLSGDEQQRAEMDRQQFEGSRTGFYATQGAHSDRLAQYVFAASAAVWAEAQSKATSKVGFFFPVDPASTTLGSTLGDAEVALVPGAGFTLNFDVPAAYFYALSASLATSVSAEQRYRMATLQDEGRIVSDLGLAIESDVIALPAINPVQAARRLVALGSANTTSLPQCPLNAEINTLLTAPAGWLAFLGPDIDAFWTGNPFPAAHLDLLLSAITQQSPALITAIKAIPVNNVDTLRKLTTTDWETFFLPGNVALLPPFTAPGTPSERVDAFVRQLRKFFGVPVDVKAPVAKAANAIPALTIAANDPINAFIGFYNVNPIPPFAFGSAHDQPSFDQAVQDVFPGDTDAQAWLEETLRAIDDLFQMTTGIDPVLQFSLMEALYARGFDSKDTVQALSMSEFERALTGTVAYPFANQIYANAGGTGGPGQSEPGKFKPVNPDGSLVNCIPPWHLSPLGPVEYLHELLKASSASTCDNPTPRSTASLGTPTAGRRGPLGSLHATAANLHTPLPLIDLVNENLEALASGSAAGVVYDTNSTQLAGHDLRPAGPEAPKKHQHHHEPFLHDPTTLFAAIPEHSSPATPVDRPNGYDLLRSDFTAPALPYSQRLDVSRSYLHQLGSSRFQTMRTFRQDITEFALNPALEPVDFQRHLWRYPVRIEIAREYLGISPEEYDLLYTKEIVTMPAAGQLSLLELYGFTDDSVGGKDWTTIVLEVPEFRKRMGLSYCEFIDLWKSKFVEFKRAGDDPLFPECEPCCAERLVIEFVEPSDPIRALTELAVFIRLWRAMRHVHGAKYTFPTLSDICQVLQLFKSGKINPDFIRQLAAFQMLRDDLHLSLGDKHAATGATGADRTRLLGLWTGAGSPSRDWAVEHLLGRIEDYAEARHAAECGGGRHREIEAEFMKIIRENLDPALSDLAGFDATSTDKWDVRPASTLRLSEILVKLYLSDFTTGEILFLFTANTHLDGDDPFPQQDDNEALDLPFDLPEDDHPFGLWCLRGKLLDLEVSDEEAAKWTWRRISHSFHEEFGYDPAGGPGPLQLLGEHFFPGILSSHGVPVGILQRQYRTPLAVTKAGRWNSPQGPFSYDSTTHELYTQLPLGDEAVNEVLSHLDQLTSVEQTAVQQLYFSPRTDLAPFALIFENFTEAESSLIEEPEESERWSYFQRAFALFHARCLVIARHLAEHVSDSTDGESTDWELAWALLRRLLADENLPSGPWEQDSGQRPASNLWPLPGGGAFAALLGLTGTGLLGQFADNGAAVWNEVRGPASAFGSERNKSNTPFPTILPSLAFVLPPGKLKSASIDNGMARRNADGEHLGGVQGLDVVWSGVLLVEQAGSYQFFAGAPTPRGQAPDFEICEHNRWRVRVQRGQKTWLLLNHRWSGEDAPDASSEPVHLRRGAYSFKVEFVQKPAEFDEPGDAFPRHTGFEIKHKGPDTGEELEAISIKRLYRDVKNGTLALPTPLPQAAQQFLELHYTSSLRDMRRTYQRAFKAVLFAHRLRLSQKRAPRRSQSELGYMLDHAQEFFGTSYFPGAAGNPYSSHHAFLDFNFLPVGDPYKPPTPAVDDRTSPSLKRRQALFDWFERLCDYTVMRRHAGQRYHHRLVWLLFVEAGDDQPADLTELLLHLAIDLQHGPLLFKFYQGKVLDWPDLVDERWPLRIWHADRWVRRLLDHFVPLDLVKAQPELWASDDGVSMAAGNANLTRFYQDGCFEIDEPRRYEDVKRLNDGLRERARTALLAYLCGMDRIGLPWGAGQFAKEPKDLSALLLLDVESGLCQRASRIEEAITAVQLFIERARLGMESTLAVSEAFVCAWDRVFSTFRVWQACKRRTIYRENFIDWEELGMARKSEAYHFLESELRRSTLTAAVPGGMEYWPGEPLPAHPSVTALQHRDPSHLRQVSQPENLGLMGAPERDARPSWLAPSQELIGNRDDDGGTPDPDDTDGEPFVPILTNVTTFSGERQLPLWIQSAIRLGVRFLRIAVAGEAPASSEFKPHHYGEGLCCCQCGKVHPPLMDEYYFWLVDSRYYTAQTQDADWGATPADPTSDWERDAKLPSLLHWPAKPMVRLAWCRVHNGEFAPPRRSAGGAHVKDSSDPQLQFEGRTGDSLRFSISAAAADELPIGFEADPSPWGFRYDIAPDTATVLPEVVPPPAPSSALGPGGLTAYPHFAYFEPGAPLQSSLFSAAIAVAGTLRAHCKYEAALKWYELSFKPLEDDNRWSRCGDIVDEPPDERPPIEVTHDPDNEGDERGTRDPEIPQLPENPCCQTEIVSDALVHERSILLHYTETLAQFGDAVMCCRNSPEAFQKGLLLFDTLAGILGSRPAIIFSHDEAKNPQSVEDFVPLFAPLNPRLMELYDIVEDRLNLIHHCLNKRRLRGGKLHLNMSYWGDSSVRRGWHTTEEPCISDDDECCCARSPYRFLFLVQKAQETAADVRALGSQLLAAFEKGDAEYIAALRAAHERQIIDLTREIRQNEWRESDWQVQALKKTKEGAQARRHYYASLIANGLIGTEQAYVGLTGVSMVTRTAGNVVEAVGQGMNLVPDPTLGVAGIFSTPVSVFAVPVGTKLANSFSAAARILYTVADITGTSASLSLTEAGWDRRLQDWIQQVTVIDIEIDQIERQILGAQRRRDVALRQLNNTEQQQEQAAELQDFLRDKFTSHALYLFLQQETTALYYQMYEVAACWARQAQRAFNLETGHATRKFLPERAWDNLQEGLLAGERLQVSLRSMEKSFADQNFREYELTKHISLRFHFPVEFLRLKTTGCCEIEVPEWMFDLDYPGQFMRRIKSFSVTIPCVTGPYTGVHCRLTLLSSATRIDPTLLKVERCCHDEEKCCSNCQCGNGYTAILDDPRFVHQYAATEAVATSSGVNDNGMFELNFRDERYLPFEYRGAVSRLRIELPPKNNQFDLETVSDFILHLNYMAREGGDILRRAACEATDCCLPGGGLRFFDVQQDFAEDWQRFQGKTASHHGCGVLNFRLNRTMFPFLTGHRDVSVCKLALFFEAPGAQPSRSHVIDFIPDRHLHHKHGGDCDCEIPQMTCVASSEWPCLYQGILEIPIATLDRQGYHEIGAFRFPDHVRPIHRAFIVCWYQATEARRCQTTGKLK